MVSAHTYQNLVVSLPNFLATVRDIALSKGRAKLAYMHTARVLRTADKERRLFRSLMTKGETGSTVLV